MKLNDYFFIGIPVLFMLAGAMAVMMQLLGGW